MVNPECLALKSFQPVDNVGSLFANSLWVTNKLMGRNVIFPDSELSTSTSIYPKTCFTPSRKNTLYPIGRMFVEKSNICVRLNDLCAIGAVELLQTVTMMLFQPSFPYQPVEQTEGKSTCYVVPLG